MSVMCARRGCPSAPGNWCPKCMPGYPNNLVDLRVAYPAR